VADTAVKGAYRFGPFQLDVRERLLSRSGDVIPLRLKVFDTLVSCHVTITWSATTSVATACRSAT
jgi:hypothetical protein